MLRPPTRPRLLAGLTIAALAGAALTAAPATAADGEPDTLTLTVTGAGHRLATTDTVEVTTYYFDGSDYVASGTTYAGGGYPIELSLGDGDYKLRVASDSPYWAAEYYDDASSLAEATPVSVQDDPVGITVDLAPQGAVVGEVVDDDGAPVANAGVALYAAGGSFVRDATTSADGVFVVPAQPGDYQLKAYSPWGSDLVAEWYGDTAGMADATVITVPAGGAGVSLDTIELEPGGSVSGTVTAPGGAPLEDVLVGALTESGEQLGWADTDAAGHYRIDDLKAGEVVVTFRDTVGGYRDEWYDDATDLAGADPVVVATSAVTGDVDAELATTDGPVADGTAVTGRALDRAGKPLPRIWVSAYVRDDDEWDYVDEAMTDRFGRYLLDDVDEKTSSGEDTVLKLVFEDTADAEDRFAHRETWYGDQPTLKRATALTVPWGQVVTGVDAHLAQYGGLRGTVTAPVPLDDAEVSVEDTDGLVVWSGEVAGDGTWATRSLPAGVYRVHVRGIGYDPETGAPVLLAPAWWKAGNNFSTATPVAVTGGAFAADVDVALTDRLQAYDAPAVTGSPVVGQLLRATPGRWNVTAGTEYAYTWLRGATVVGAGPTYRPTVADAGSTLRVRVDALFWDWAGTATSAATATVKQVSSTAVTGTYARKKRTLKLAVRVSAAGLVPTGSVKVVEGKRTVKAALVLVAGKATLVVKRPTRGAHTYVVTYPGSAQVLGSTGKVTVTVK